MARVTGVPTVELKVSIELTEQEAGALGAMVGYGVDPFLLAFYEKLGKSYMQPYEPGLRSLFESLHATLPGLLQRAGEARKTFKD